MEKDKMKYRFNNKTEYNVKQAYVEYELESCKEFQDSSSKIIRDNWNGIGREGAWYNGLIPNTVYGLDISLTTADHDLAYALLRHLVDKKLADDRFYRNMCKLIDKESHWSLKWLRKRRALKYYLAVRYFGFSAFNKSIDNPSIELVEGYEKSIDLNRYRIVGILPI